MSASGRRRLLAAALVSLSLSAGCIKSPPDPNFVPVPTAGPESVDQVVFLVGDGGEALFDRSPLMVRLKRDVEAWSAALAREEAVSVLFLGDNVYPSGIHDVGDSLRAADSLRLHAQVETLSGENARRYRNRGFFVAGNHDWGNLTGQAGIDRLANMDAMLDAYGSIGVRVDLYPKPGLPGPTVVDAGEAVRFVFIDTHWWLQAGHENTLRDTIFFNVNQILGQSEDRALVFASHHPFVSGGMHGGPVPVWRGFGILWLLKKTGSLVQALNSPIYRELQGGLTRLFAEIRRPLIYAGGHDHSLQVIEEVSPERPQWSLVSGSASKLTDVGPASGMKFAVDRPGFMRLAFRRDGAVELHVYAAPSEFQHCGDNEEEDVASCMLIGPDLYEEVYSSQLREPHSVTPVADTTGAR